VYFVFKNIESKFDLQVVPFWDGNLIGPARAKLNMARLRKGADWLGSLFRGS